MGLLRRAVEALEGIKTALERIEAKFIIERDCEHNWVPVIGREDITHRCSKCPSTWFGAGK